MPIFSPFGTGSTSNSLPSGQSTGSDGTICPFVQVALIAFMVHVRSNLILTEKGKRAM
jgi:hypothetical protein